MKTNLKRWIGGVPDVSDVMSRFPMAVLAMAIFTVILICVLFTNPSYEEEIARTLLGIVIAAFSCVIISIAREVQRKPKLISLQIGVLVVFPIIFLFSEPLRLNLYMAVGTVLLLIGNAITWRQPRNDLHLWDFTHKIWTGAGFAFLGVIIFSIGMFAIQAALKTLFGINTEKLTTRLILPIGLGLLAPLYWLSTVPAIDEPYDELVDNPGFVSKSVAFLGTWLLSPLTLIYALILAAYGLKVIFAGTLPKGEIAQLTIPFLLIGTLTWLVLEPPFIRTKALANLFRKFWFLISFPAAVMLLIAVYARVNVYGLTPERAALCLIVFWILGLGLWFTAGPKSKRSLRLIPGSAAVLLLFGTLFSGWISISSQTNRLNDSLKQAISKTENGFEVLDMKAAQKAKGAIEYLNKEKARDHLKRAFLRIGYEPKKGFTLVNIYDDLGLKGIEPRSRFDRLFISTVKKYENKPINIAGFDQTLGQYKLYFNSHNASEEYILYADGGIEITVHNGKFKLSIKDNVVPEYDFVELVERASNKDMPFVFYERDERKAAIHISSSSIRTHSINDAHSPNGNVVFYIFLKGFKL